MILKTISDVQMKNYIKALNQKNLLILRNCKEKLYYDVEIIIQ